MSNTGSAAGDGLPSAKIIPLPVQSKLLTVDVSRPAFLKAFSALSFNAQFAGMDDANIDRALLEMIETSSTASVEHVIRENGEVLQMLRDATAFLASMDLRLQSSAFRIVEKELQ